MTKHDCYDLIDEGKILARALDKIEKRVIEKIAEKVAGAHGGGLRRGVRRYSVDEIEDGKGNEMTEIEEYAQRLAQRALGLTETKAKVVPGFDPKRNLERAVHDTLGLAQGIERNMRCSAEALAIRDLRGTEDHRGRRDAGIGIVPRGGRAANRDRTGGR